MASPGLRIDLASAMLTPFEDNARAREAVTNTSVLGKHGRGSETSSETVDKGEDGGAACSQAFRLWTDFDIPKQVRLSVCAQQITRLYNPFKQMAEQNGHVQLRPSRTPAALGRLYNSAIRDGTTVLPMTCYIQSIIQQYEPVAPVAQR